MHKIISAKDNLKIDKINIKVENINLNLVDINVSKETITMKAQNLKGKEVKTNKYKYSLFYNQQYVGTIVLLKK